MEQEKYLFVSGHNTENCSVKEMILALTGMINTF